MRQKLLAVQLLGNITPYGGTPKRNRTARREVARRREWLGRELRGTHMPHEASSAQLSTTNHPPPRPSQLPAAAH